jgi:hypothetical protein
VEETNKEVAEREVRKLLGWRENEEQEPERTWGAVTYYGAGRQERENNRSRNVTVQHSADFTRKGTAGRMLGKINQDRGNSERIRQFEDWQGTKGFINE